MLKLVFDPYGYLSFRTALLRLNPMCFPPLPWLTFASEPSHIFNTTAAGKLSEELPSKGSETYIRDFVSC